MSSSTMDQRGHFICSQNRAMHRSKSPMMAVEQLFDSILEEAYPEYRDITVIDSLEGGVREKYGDYGFFGVVDLCNKLREDDPFYFHRKGPIQIAGADVCVSQG